MRYTRTSFTLIPSVDRAFTDLYGEGADDERCEAFASRWGGLDLEQMERAFAQGEGEEKVLAILALGNTETVEVRTRLLAFLTQEPPAPLMERFAYALCLGRVHEQHAYPLLESLVRAGLSLDENREAEAQEDDTHRHELSWCNGWRSSLLATLRDWDSPTWLSTLRQGFKDLWEIQRELHPTAFPVWLYDQFAYLLGKHHAFDVLHEMDLPQTHRDAAMVFLALGAVDPRPDLHKSLLSFYIDHKKQVQKECADILTDVFGLTKEEQTVCFNRLYDSAYAREKYGRAYEKIEDSDDDEDLFEPAWRGPRIERVIEPPLLRQYVGHTQRVHDVAWSPDDTAFVSASEDMTARIWDVSTEEVLHTFQAHTDSVNTVSWSPHGTWIASGSNDRTVRVWHSQTGETRCIYHGHHAWIIALAWSADGSRVASASLDGTVQIWHALSGEQQFTLRGHKGIVRSLAWSPDGKQLVSGGGYPEALICVWDAQHGVQTGVYRGHQEDTEQVRVLPPYDLEYEWEKAWYREASSVHQLSWSPESTRVASWGLRGICRVWDAQTGEDLLVADHKTDGPIAWVADGRGLYWVPQGDRKVVDRYHLSTNTVQIRYQINNRGYSMQRLAFSPTQRFLATYGEPAEGLIEVRAWR